mmetsp:Transcript_31499/g.106061  ORF Transcript_31499/g.106061 Transcript_31499/m.106061 type:complete len:391 (+) Transcript_31499:71-1243(+)
MVGRPVASVCGPARRPERRGGATRALQRELDPRPRAPRAVRHRDVVQSQTKGGQVPAHAAEQALLRAAPRLHLHRGEERRLEPLVRRRRGPVQDHAGRPLAAALRLAAVVRSGHCNNQPGPGRLRGADSAQCERRHAAVHGRAGRRVAAVRGRFCARQRPRGVGGVAPQLRAGARAGRRRRRRRHSHGPQHCHKRRRGPDPQLGKRPRVRPALARRHAPGPPEPALPRQRRFARGRRHGLARVPGPGPALPRHRRGRGAEGRGRAPKSLRLFQLLRRGVCGRVSAVHGHGRPARRRNALRRAQSARLQRAHVEAAQAHGQALGQVRDVGSARLWPARQARFPRATRVDALRPAAPHGPAGRLRLRPPPDARKRAAQSLPLRRRPRRREQA